MGKKFKFRAKEKINRLPKNPGAYAFKSKEEILYIGKAGNIRERVKNHFQKPSFKEKFFLDRTRKIGFIITDSEIEALILEANLIKKYRPKHNIVWRDDKNYFYVGITKEDFPKIFITHQPRIRNQKLETRYVGPFVDGKALKQTLKILRKIFPYKSCKTLPKKPCLWYQLDRCPAPCCVGTVGLLKSRRGQTKPSPQIIPGLKESIKVKCQENAKNILKIIQGKKTQVLKSFKKEMRRAADSQKFERATDIRDKIFVLEKVVSNAKIFQARKKEIKYSKIEEKLKDLLKTRKKMKRIEAYDVSNIQGQLATGSMVTFIKGVPTKEFYRKFKIKFSKKPDDVAMIKEILSRRLEHHEWGYPDLILIDGGRAQLNAAVKVKKTKVIALAKKKNELYIRNRKPILLKTLSREIFNLILQLRDEAHRFAFTYHKKLREKKLMG